MPSNNHVVVDFSRFPIEELVTSTKLAKVIPALGEIYNAYRNSEMQISDNGRLLNSKEMENFTKKTIEMKKIPPIHPSYNPVENTIESISVFPAAKMFGDDKQTYFPKKRISEEECIKARSRNNGLKPETAAQINCSKYRKKDDIKGGDKVLMRNYKKQSKFDPVFIPEPYKVLSTNWAYDNCRKLSKWNDMETI